MQINFEAKRLKEANEYVDLLNPPKIKIPKIIKHKKETSIIERILKFLFK